MTLVRTRKIIDEAGAEAVLAAAERKALADGHRVVIAVVDPWGELVALRRTQGAQVRLLEGGGGQGAHGGDLRAAQPRDGGAGHQRPTRRARAPRRLRLTGGIPLRVDSEAVGAIGTSGETPDEDESMSIAGAAADFSILEVPALTQEGAKRSWRRSERRRRARRGARDVRGGRRGRAHVPAPSRRCPGGERRGDDGQGADRRDLPAAEQGLRGPGLRRPPSALHLARAVPLQGGKPIGPTATWSARWA